MRKVAKKIRWGFHRSSLLSGKFGVRRVIFFFFLVEILFQSFWEIVWAKSSAEVPRFWYIFLKGLFEIKHFSFARRDHELLSAMLRGSVTPATLSPPINGKCCWCSYLELSDRGGSSDRNPGECVLSLIAESVEQLEKAAEILFAPVQRSRRAGCGD